MGKDARLRKLRNLARQQLDLGPAKTAFASTFEKEHPNSVVRHEAAAEKMSEVLEAFAEPLLDAAQSQEDIKKALLFAMTAWNYSLLNDAAEAQQCACPSMFADPDARQILDFLVARKQQLYPNNRRVILDYQLIPKGTEFQFNFISTSP